MCVRARHQAVVRAAQRGAGVRDDEPVAGRVPGRVGRALRRLVTAADGADEGRAREHLDAGGVDHAGCGIGGAVVRARDRRPAAERRGGVPAVRRPPLGRPGRGRTARRRGPGEPGGPGPRAAGSRRLSGRGSPSWWRGAPPTARSPICCRSARARSRTTCGTSSAGSGCARASSRRHCSAERGRGGAAGRGRTTTAGRPATAGVRCRWTWWGSAPVRRPRTRPRRRSRRRPR